MFLRPKGLKVVSYVEFTAESKYDMLAKIKVERFSENPYDCVQNQETATTVISRT